MAGLTFLDSYVDAAYHRRINPRSPYLWLILDDLDADDILLDTDSFASNLCGLLREDLAALLVLLHELTDVCRTLPYAGVNSDARIRARIRERPKQDDHTGVGPRLRPCGVGFHDDVDLSVRQGVLVVFGVHVYDAHWMIKAVRYEISSNPVAQLDSVLAPLRELYELDRRRSLGRAVIVGR